jgi:hypothetical protein
VVSHPWGFPSILRRKWEGFVPSSWISKEVFSLDKVVPCHLKIDEVKIGARAAKEETTSTFTPRLPMLDPYSPGIPNHINRCPSFTDFHLAEAGHAILVAALSNLSDIVKYIYMPCANKYKVAARLSIRHC